MEDHHTVLDRIKCPKCGELIPISEAITQQIAARMRAEFKAETELQQKTFEEQAKKKAREVVSIELKDLREEADEKNRKLEEAEKTELELRKENRALAEKNKNVDLEVARQMDAEKIKIQEETTRQLQA